MSYARSRLIDDRRCLWWWQRCGRKERCARYEPPVPRAAIIPDTVVKSVIVTVKISLPRNQQGRRNFQHMESADIPLCRPFPNHQRLGTCHRRLLWKQLYQRWKLSWNCPNEIILSPTTCIISTVPDATDYLAEHVWRVLHFQVHGPRAAHVPSASQRVAIAVLTAVFSSYEAVVLSAW